MSTIIRVDGLSKVFHTRQKRNWWSMMPPPRRQRAHDVPNPHVQSAVKVALHPTDFQVDAGETIAFIGPNGAGKSTTIKMLTGILHPSAGDATVLGHRPWENRVALSYEIGTVFGQKSQLWYHLPPRDTFDLTGRIYDISKPDYRKRRDELVDRFRLGPLMDTPVRKLSLGERMRCEIAISFLHRPRILFLDEPTIGLDVLVKQSIRELIRDLNRSEGVTVFLTSHDATDVESLCERVLVINNGSLLFDGATSHLVRRFLHYKEVRLHLADDNVPLAVDGVDVEHLGDGYVRLVIDVERVRIDTLLTRILQQHEVRDVSIVEPSMEEIIRTIYEETDSRPSIDVDPAGEAHA